ncbi:flagellar basal body-associated FliL family protein [Roseomonas sp. CCTCC AB2023176]|uniref:flagellar basal body-associated FliL family protein n=1 Tax=Roseomonas sp. CCTCC AB2023176 TaxID=3342640 RepID=UPI0035D9C7C2
MASAAAANGPAEVPAKKGGKAKIVLLALPMLLGGAGAGLWFTGVLPGLLGMHAPAPARATDTAPRPPAFHDLPEILTNLNVPGRRPTFIRLRAKLEIARAEDAAAVQAAQPRLLDLFQTYLREMRPEELRGSPGTHRLREELRARANIALHPVRVLDVLFTEIVVQ